MELDDLVANGGPQTRVNGRRDTWLKRAMKKMRRNVRREMALAVIIAVGRWFASRLRNSQRTADSWGVHTAVSWPGSSPLSEAGVDKAHGS
jgi:hypothetical protein